MRASVQPYADQLAKLLASPSGDILPEDVQRFRWMVEEYHVSVFAQKLGTAGKVSPKKLDEKWIGTEEPVGASNLSIAGLLSGHGELRGLPVRNLTPHPTTRQPAILG